MQILVATRLIDRSECRLYQGLRKGGAKIEVFCHPNAQHQDTLMDSGVPITHLDVRHRLDRKAIHILRRRVEQKGYDVIYASDNSTLAASLHAARSLPVQVVGYRGTTGHLHPWDPGSRLTYLNRRVNHIVCVSHAVRHFLHNKMHLPAERLTTIYKGHDVTWYPSPDPLDRSQFEIPHDAFVVAFSGRMRPVKGGIFLLRALAELIPSLPRIHLLLIGEIHDRQVMRQLENPRLRDHIHCTGHRTDAPGLVGACDLFVMPSIDREGLPRAVIEAMAQSRPVVACQVGGLPELVAHGETGHLVPPRDAYALAAAIRFFAEHPEQGIAFGRRGRKRMETLFTIEETIQKTRKLFAELVRQAESDRAGNAR